MVGDGCGCVETLVAAATLRCVLDLSERARDAIEERGCPRRAAELELDSFIDSFVRGLGRVRAAYRRRYGRARLPSQSYRIEFGGQFRPRLGQTVTRAHRLPRS